LTCDLQFQSHVSNGSNTRTCKRSRSKISWFKRQSGSRRTDRWTEAIDWVNA